MFKKHSKKSTEPCRERDFFKLLNGQASKTLEGMEALEKFMTVEDPDAANQVFQAEDAADDIRRALIDELNRNFVTPIDREDIFALSRAIDDVVDYANSTVEEMTTLEVHPNEHLRIMASLLREGAFEISRAVAIIKDRPQVATQYAVKAKTLENQVEKHYREAVAALFKEKLKSLDDVAEMMKLREIYRHLSNAADRGDEAADILCDIIIKMT